MNNARVNRAKDRDRYGKGTRLHLSWFMSNENKQKKTHILFESERSQHTANGWRKIQKVEAEMYRAKASVLETLFRFTLSDPCFCVERDEGTFMGNFGGHWGLMNIATSIREFHYFHYLLCDLCGRKMSVGVGQERLTSQETSYRGNGEVRLGEVEVEIAHTGYGGFKFTPWQ